MLEELDGAEAVVLAIGWVVWGVLGEVELEVIESEPAGDPAEGDVLALAGVHPLHRAADPEVLD